MSELATRNSFLTGCKRRYDTLDLPSGTTVRFQSLSEAEDAAYQMQLFVRDATGLLMRDENGNLIRDDIAIANERSRLIVMCLVDANGQRILTEADIPQVDQLDGADTRALYATLLVHCGMRERPEAKKNASSTSSSPTPDTSSTTSSPPS